MTSSSGGRRGGARWEAARQRSTLSKRRGSDPESVAEVTSASRMRAAWKARPARISMLCTPPCSSASLLGGLLEDPGGPGVVALGAREPRREQVLVQARAERLRLVGDEPGQPVAGGVGVLTGEGDLDADAGGEAFGRGGR